MSNDIRNYRINSGLNADNYNMHVIALAGQEAWTAFEIDGMRATLSEAQTLDLISVLSRRLLRRKGFQATESSLCMTVVPDGSMLIEKENEDEEVTRP